MARKYTLVLASVLLSIIFIGCATMPTAQQDVAKYTATFNYTAPTQAALGSAGVTFTVTDVIYKSEGKVSWLAYSQFDNLANAAKEDLTEILLAKGISIRGPFNSYDLIPFSDKKAIDLYLVPAVNLSVTFKDGKEKLESIWAAPPVGLFTGNIEVNGDLNLELREIATRELMWSKTIPLTKIEFPYNIRIPYYAQGQSYDLKPFIMNDVAKKVEEQYSQLMDTAYKIIDPEEMKIIQKQAQELKSKKGY